jgi:hypothetical protein
MKHRILTIAALFALLAGPMLLRPAAARADQRLSAGIVTQVPLTTSSSSIVANSGIALTYAVVRTPGVVHFEIAPGVVVENVASYSATKFAVAPYASWHVEPACFAQVNVGFITAGVGEVLRSGTLYNAALLRSTSWDTQVFVGLRF